MMKWMTLAAVSFLTSCGAAAQWQHAPPATPPYASTRHTAPAYAAPPYAAPQHAIPQQAAPQHTAPACAGPRHALAGGPCGHAAEPPWCAPSSPVAGYPMASCPPQPASERLRCDLERRRRQWVDCGWLGGFEFLWLRASFDQDVALVIDPPVGNVLVPFDYSANFSPRVWLGLQSCSGLGFRTTYFGFDEDGPSRSAAAVAGATPVYVSVNGADGNLTRNATANVGETLSSAHWLQIQAVDLEATHAIVWAEFRTLLGIGIRIGDIDQAFRANVTDAGGMLQQAVGNTLDFTGAGPTLSAELTRDLGRKGCQLYASGRTSLLIGDIEQRIYEMKGAFTTELEDYAEQRKTIGNLELALGLQYGQSIGRAAGAFARVGYEAQWWTEAGGPVNATDSIGLHGVAFALGLNF